MKRRQHFVWKHYLTAWVTGKTLWCSRGGKLFRSSPVNVGLETDFYRLKEMADSDIEWIERYCISTITEPDVRDHARSFIEPFTIHRLRGHLPPEDEADLDIVINNLEEDWHALIEQLGIPVLDTLMNNPSRLLTDPKIYADFVLYLMAQYLRTPKMRQNMMAEPLGLPDFNIDAAWGLFRTILTVTYGEALSRKHMSLGLTVLKAGPGTEFITGDQPVVAIHAQLGEVTRKDELYYPLSPDVAVQVRFDRPQATFEEKSLTTQEVAICNDRIASAAKSQLYAASRSVLARLPQPPETTAE